MKFREMNGEGVKGNMTRYLPVIRVRNEAPDEFPRRKEKKR